MKENTGATPQLNMVPQPSTRDARPETRDPQPVTLLPTETSVKAGDARPATHDPGLATGGAPRREGGQPGNQNARVHGFYSKRAPVYRQDVIDEASELQGLDGEISFLRSCIEWVAEMDPPNPKLAGELVRTLSIAMVRRKYAGHLAIIDKAKRLLGNVGVVAGAAGGVAQVVQAIKK